MIREPFAFFMDMVVRPVVWCLSPSLRAHDRAVKYQDAHLRGPGHNPPRGDCGWCQEGHVWRG